MAQAIQEERFFWDGRGPELRKIWWSDEGASIRAIDYAAPDGASINHVTFRGPQVVMIAPEEVADQSSVPLDASRTGLLDFGRSPWLETFLPTHLGKCRHYRLTFYDEVIDVICEELVFSAGSYGAK